MEFISITTIDAAEKTLAWVNAQPENLLNFQTAVISFLILAVCNNSYAILQAFRELKEL